MIASATALWYLTRATGVVALLLLTSGVLLGVMTTVGWRTRSWPRFLSSALHRNVTLLAIAFVGVHVATTVLDGYAPVSWLDAVVPFASPYRPVWLGLGAVAFDLLLALVATSLLRRRLGYRAWRVVHWLAYASWPVALVHALGTGSDARFGWMAALGVVSIVVVVGAVLWRAAAGWREGDALPRIGGAVAAVAAALVVLGWWAGGPGAGGWAKRAGTPASLLALHRQAAPAAVRRTAGVRAAAAAVPAAPFRARLDGTIAVTQPDSSGLVTVRIDARTAAPAGRLLIVLRGQALDGGGVAMTASRVTFGPGGDPYAYRGPVTSLSGSRLDATLSGPSLPDVHLAVRLDIGSTGSRVTGTVAATRGAPATQLAE